MKSIALLLFWISISFVSIAQEKRVDELTQKVQQLEQVIKDQQERNQYLKQALALKNSGVEVKNENISIRITKIWGSVSEQRIYIQGLVSYQGSDDQSLQFDSHELVAPSGNQYVAYSAGLPNDQQTTFHVSRAEADIPYGFSIQVEDIKERVATLALVRLKLYGHSLEGPAFSFRGLDVDWKE